MFPCNLYGPDNFDPKSSHVIPALIKKIIYAKNNNNIDSVGGEMEVLLRNFYVKDCAEIIIKSLGKIGQYRICNIGSGFEKETSIRIKYIIYVRL